MSGTSARRDRKVKAPIYGESHVPEYWIVDISGDDLIISRRSVVALIELS
ncbi:MAG: Uma2 family endonuclease [Myxococcota bacterium]|nr:Uma2 family endonuclease [Deltaproteobacteria bacterium]MDQ3333783.1 Uma2 family endonuclease [Myxococcota bacterium]